MKGDKYLVSYYSVEGDVDHMTIRKVSEDDCPDCEGTGEVIARGTVSMYSVCPRCDGGNLGWR